MRIKLKIEKNKEALVLGAILIFVVLVTIVWSAYFYIILQPRYEYRKYWQRLYTEQELILQILRQNQQNIQTLLSKSNTVTVWSGKVSWYGGVHNGQLTANAERFSEEEPTAAHPFLPFNTKVLVLVPSTKRWSVVRINDRGPARWTGRELDVSKSIAEELGFVKEGVVDAILIVFNNDDEELFNSPTKRERRRTK